MLLVGGSLNRNKRGMKVFYGFGPIGDGCKDIYKKLGSILILGRKSSQEQRYSFLRPCLWKCF